MIRVESSSTQLTKLLLCKRIPLLLACDVQFLGHRVHECALICDIVPISTWYTRKFCNVPLIFNRVITVHFTGYSGKTFCNSLKVPPYFCTSPEAPWATKLWYVYLHQSSGSLIFSFWARWSIKRRWLATLFQCPKGTVRGAGRNLESSQWYIGE